MKPTQQEQAMFQRLATEPAFKNWLMDRQRDAVSILANHTDLAILHRQQGRFAAYQELLDRIVS